MTDFGIAMVKGYEETPQGDFDIHNPPRSESQVSPLQSHSDEGLVLQACYGSDDMNFTPNNTDDSIYYYYLTRGQSVGVTIVVEAGLASLVAVLYVFFIILRNFIWRIRNVSREKWHVFQTPMDLLMFSLFSAELLQAIGCVMSLKWIHEGIVQVGGFCRAQGVIKQFGQTGGSITILLMTLYTFVGIWLGKTATSIRVTTAVLFAAWLSVAAVVIIGNTVNERPGQAPFIAPVPICCNPKLTSSSRQSVIRGISFRWSGNGALTSSFSSLLLGFSALFSLSGVINVVLLLTTRPESVLFGKQSHFSSGRAPPSPYQESVHNSEVDYFDRESRDEDDTELESVQSDIIDVDDVVLPSTSSPPRHSPPQCPTFSDVALPDTLTQSITSLSKHDLAILRKKRKWLREFTITIPPVRNGKDKDMTPAVNATLVFAQEDAGTAVCIDPNGILLTCSHCVAESAEELEDGRVKWLIFASGQVVKAECVAWDPSRDLALLQIVVCQRQPTATSTLPSSSSTPQAPVQIQSFPFVIPADLTPPLRLGAALICIGHPGSEDLEASKPGVKTSYDVLHVSTGMFRGYAPGQDVQDNAEIGALMHDCWTYWGHSGAPLVEQLSGRLVGLHSSWDDQTGMRRGIGLEAVKAFLGEHEELWTVGGNQVDE
ncbi:hypothetical protein GALMADRAFT_1354687 [Galerina marginata CBS 339.88]|uniref:Serine protease n=1 Tax=Galerina marginata (strain CBS 339.88) TaxID=685588 RepID=A0A067SN73_GALM3|nr:hypothetical protein GALMADRAFT_1354687 [Galerina marginata CBS 339.88]